MRSRRLLSLMAAGAMLMTCAFPVKADVEEYELWIGGTQITSENKDELPNLLGPDAKGSFDPDTKTLYLKGVEGIDNAAPDNEYGIRGYNIDLTFHIDSDIDIKNNDGLYRYGIYLTGTTIIEGEGTLNTAGKELGIYTRTLELHDADITINATAVEPSYRSTIGYDAETINISAGVINATGVDYGMNTSVINSTGGTINAEGDHGIDLFAYMIKAALIMDGGIVNANGTSIGIHSGTSYADYKFKSGILTAKGDERALRVFTLNHDLDLFDLSENMKVRVPQDGNIEIEEIAIEGKACNVATVADKNGVPAGQTEIADRAIVRFVYPGFDVERSQIVLIGKKVSEPQAPDLGGKYVHGWYNDEALTEPFDLSGKISHSITLYARLENVAPTKPPKPTTKPTPTTAPTVTSSVKATPSATPSVSAKPTSTTVPTVTVRPVSPTSEPAVTPTVTSEPKDPEEQIFEFVARIYKYVLDREPEAEGAKFWTDELYSFRRTGAEVGLGFIFSDEFVNRGLSDEEYVTVLYNTFFGREPEDGGFKFWTSALASGSLDRMGVANGFVYSQEWADTCARYGIRSGGEIKPGFEIEPTAATLAFVERMYTTAMNREADPSGLEFWSKELANFRYSGEQVGVMFFLSEEMQGYGLSDSEFVTRLYKTFMDREPEEGGFKFWVGYLADGGSREGAVLGFTRSEEFVNKCIEARILPF